MMKMTNTMRETMKKKNKIRFSFTRKPEPGSHRQRKAPLREEEEEEEGGGRGRRMEAYYL
jgi:hypothetical protein